jgi:hypothetical protein
MEMEFVWYSNSKQHGDRALPEIQDINSMKTALCVRTKSQASWKSRLPENKVTKKWSPRFA